MSDIINQILSSVDNQTIQFAYVFTSLLSILTLLGFGVGFIFGFVKRVFIMSSY